MNGDSMSMRSLEAVRLIQDRRPEGSTPLFSVIIALYNAEEYVRATIASLEAQTIDKSSLEFIVVDDGSTDESLNLARNWAARDQRVVLMTKPNEGISWTRRRALEKCRGQWVTAVDPDDLVGRDYFEEVAKMIALDDEDQVALYSARVMIVNGETGRFRDSHPLGAKFRKGNRFVSLESEPNSVQLGATCFLRKSILDEHSLTYEPEVRPTFEDGHLICRYLGHFVKPIIGLVSTARYFYRKRADDSSAVQSGWKDRDKFVVQPSAGYLDAVEYVERLRGNVPAWLAMALLYDLMWYFKEYHKMGSSVRWVDDDARRIFMDTCESIFAHLSKEHLDELAVNTPRFVLREALAIGFGLYSTRARLLRWGTRNGATTWTLELADGEHEIVVFRNGVRTVPSLNGTTVHEYFGRVLMRELSFVLPTGDVAVFVDGKPVPLGSVKRTAVERPSDPVAEGLTNRARAVAHQQTDLEKRLERLQVRSGITNVSRSVLVARRLLRMRTRTVTAPPIADSRIKSAKDILSADPRRFDGCWILLDHPGKADDNAEHLYRYLHREHPKRECYFLLERASGDWRRLQDEGFRLIEYGSAEAWAAASRASVVVSSDAVGECMHLLPKESGLRESYKFVFLQHGILDKDISDWLNGKKIDLTLASIPREYEAFVWDESKYSMTAPMVALTGLPRYDRLLAMAEEVRSLKNERQPVSLLIMPTWRRNLKLALEGAGSDAERMEIVRESQFLNAWMDVVGDDRIRNAVEAGRLVVRFLAHPNLVDFQYLIALPEWVEMVDVRTASFQELVVDADLFISDYSSLIFDVAYAGGAVAYYQFDRELMGTGIHSWTPGYFDYETMGLGPVLRTSEDVVGWVEKGLDRCLDPARVYAKRVDATFAYRDQQNCERVVGAIEHMLAGDGAWVVNQAGAVVGERMVGVPSRGSEVDMFDGEMKR